MLTYTLLFTINLMIKYTQRVWNPPLQTPQQSLPMPTLQPEHLFRSFKFLTVSDAHLAPRSCGTEQKPLTNTYLLNQIHYLDIFLSLVIHTLHGIVSYILKNKALSISFKAFSIISSCSLWFEKARLLDLFYHILCNSLKVSNLVSLIQNKRNNMELFI